MCKNGSLKDFLGKYNEQKGRSKELKPRPSGCPTFKQLFEWCAQITRGKSNQYKDYLLIIVKLFVHFVTW